MTNPRDLSPCEHQPLRAGQTVCADCYYRPVPWWRRALALLGLGCRR